MLAMYRRLRLEVVQVLLCVLQSCSGHLALNSHSSATCISETSCASTYPYEASQTSRTQFARRGSETKGVGTFACIGIERDTLVLKESPSLYLSLGGDEQSAISWLPPASRKQFEQLDGDNATSKFHRNSFRLDHGSGIFFEASRFNHDCAPNLYWAWDEASSTINFRASRDIALGEELTTSYLGREGLTMTAAERRALLTRYGFHCECTSCENSDTSDQNRIAIGHTLQSLREIRSKGIYQEISQLGPDATAILAQTSRMTELLGEENLSLVGLHEEYFAMAELASLFGRHRQGQELMQTYLTSVFLARDVRALLESEAAILYGML